MKLPGHNRAVIEPTRITGYLLSQSHPIGRTKAAFFEGFGFNVGAWQVFVRALLSHAAVHEVTLTEANEFGTRFLVDGPLETPDGRDPLVRVAWFIRLGEDFPRLVTAYPLPKKIA